MAVVELAKTAYIGINGTPRKIRSMFVGVNGVARRIAALYSGESDGIARLRWSKSNGNAGMSRFAQFVNGDLTEIKARDFGDETAINCGWTYNLSDTWPPDDNACNAITKVTMPNTITSATSVPNDSMSISDPSGFCASLFINSDAIEVKFSRALLDLSHLYSILYRTDSSSNSVCDFSDNAEIPSIGAYSSSQRYNNCFAGTVYVRRDIGNEWEEAWAASNRVSSSAKYSHVLETKW